MSRKPNLSRLGDLNMKILLGRRLFTDLYEGFVIVAIGVAIAAVPVTLAVKGVYTLIRWAWQLI